MTDSSSNDEDITDLLYKIRYHQLGNNFILAAILLTADHTSNYIHKIINSAADNILAKHLAPNILINLIDIITWKRKRFVVTGKDFDPDRRDINR